MKIHYLQHVPFEGPAYLESVARRTGAGLTGTRLFAGEHLPGTSGIDLLAILGGPMGVHDEGDYPWLAAEKRFIGEAIDSGSKVLGICLGAQLIAGVMGARVFRNRHREIGWFPVKRAAGARSSRAGKAFPDEFMAFHWHGDTFDLPVGAVHLARSEACVNQAFIVDERVLGLQFHLEATAESVRDLHENCRGELDRSPYVQGDDHILAGTNIDGCNRLFGKIIGTLMRS